MATHPSFKLAAQLVGHRGDVRAVCFPSPETILTASRDYTVRSWHRTAPSPPTFEPHVARQGTAYVNAIAFLPPSKEHPDGLVASGDNDGLLEVVAPSALPSDNAERLLVGHSRNVCTLDVSPDNKWIISGGWDGQARIWSTEKWETELVLDTDGSTVWTVLALDDHTVATGGIDKKIRIFDLRRAIGGECEPIAMIHTSDVIRSLCRVPSSHPSGAAIASATNDLAIRLWTMQGQEVATLEGHESYIYSIASIPQTGEIVSAGEDRTLRVWNGSECVQTITHPAISVWSVAVCNETGDLVTGTSDGVARVWTRDESRVAESLIGLFDESVRASAIPREQVGGVDPQSLPGPDFLQSKSGTKEGQIQMIRQPDGAVTAHQWSASEGWIMIGNVVSSAGSSRRKVEYNGQEYDYVFDVDIEDGKPPLKLPYNVTMNPYDAATKFLGDNNLPISYLESTAKFIVDNTQGATLGTPAADGTQSSLAQEKPKGKVLPQQEYLSLLAAKYEAIFNKILNINATLVSTGRKDNALNPTDEEDLKELQKALEASPQRAVPEPAFELIIRIVARWPGMDRLAGLDLLRCIAPSPLVAGYSHPSHGSIVTLVVESGLAGDAGGKVVENCAMMAVRTVANLFVSEQGRKAVAENMADVLGLLNRVLGLAPGAAAPIGKNNRNMLVAVTTVLINLAVLGHKTTRLNAAARAQVLAMAGAVLGEQTDAEVLYRALVALGTLIVGGAAVDAAPAEVVEMRRWINGAMKRAKTETRVQDIGAECLARL